METPEAKTMALLIVMEEIIEETVEVIIRF